MYSKLIKDIYNHAERSSFFELLKRFYKKFCEVLSGFVMLHSPPTECEVKCWILSRFCPLYIMILKMFLYSLYPFLFFLLLGFSFFLFPDVICYKIFSPCFSFCCLTYVSLSLSHHQSEVSDVRVIIKDSNVHRTVL